MNPGWRSLLFVPAHDTAKVAKAANGDADAVILDLEDGVAAGSKPAARAALAEAAGMVAATGKGVVVRINSGWRLMYADLEAAVLPSVDAVMMPKAEEPSRVAVLAEILGEFENDRGLQTRSIRLIPLVESPGGLIGAAVLAAADRVIGLALGSEDFSHALGVDPTPEALDLPCRQIALAAAEVGVMALAMPLSIADYRDEPAIRTAATLASRYGATGALCIHPRQVAIVNRAMTPDANAVASAEAVLHAWETALGRNEAVTVLDGRMIDAPVAKRAQRLLARTRPTAV